MSVKVSPFLQKKKLINLKNSQKKAKKIDGSQDSNFRPQKTIEWANFGRLQKGLLKILKISLVTTKLVDVR